MPASEENRRKDKERKRDERAIEKESRPPKKKLSNEASDSLLEFVYTKKNAIKPINRESFERNTWNVMLKIHNEMFSIPFVNMKWARDWRKVVDFIKKKYSNKNTAISKITQIATIIRVISGFKVAYRNLLKIYMNDREKQIEKTDLNLSPEKELKKGVTHAQLRKAHESDKLNLKEKALVAIYTLIPPRRVEFAQYLKYSKIRTNLDMNYNYVTFEKYKSKEDVVFTLNKYKTFKTYGTYIGGTTNNKLFTILNDYIKSAKIQDGDLLFGLDKETPYVNFSPVINDVFKKATGQEISVNYIRHVYISKFLSVPRSISEKKNMAHLMGHSVAVQEKYYRIDREKLELELDDIEEEKEKSP